MYTCVAYLIEIRKFCSKNLLHNGVNFEAQNALKLTYEHLQFQKKIRGLYPQTPVKRGRRGRGKAMPLLTSMVVMQWQCDSEIFIRVYKYSTFYLYLHECCGQLVNCMKVSSCIGNLCRHPTGKGTMPLTLHGLLKGSMISAVTQKLRENERNHSFSWLSALLRG